MIDHAAPRIGVLGLMLELYDRAAPDLRPKQEQFARDELIPRLEGMGEVTYAGIQNTREGVAAAVDEFIAEDVDLVITVHLSYAPSLIALPDLLRWSGPVVMWNTQKLKGIGPGFSHAQVIENHGMHGVQDLANTLNRVGRQYAVVTGHFEDPVTLAEIAGWARAAKARRALRNARIGQVGFAFQDMGDFGVDETQFMALVGPHVVRMRLDALAESQDQAPLSALEDMLREDRERFDIAPDITEEEHLASARIEWAMRNVFDELGLDGVAIHYEALAADPRFGALPFAAASKLLAEGYGFGGEGDVTSASAVVAMQHLCGQASFSEMFTMDFEGDSIYLAHYAEANPRMARKDMRPRLCRREGWVGSGGVSTSLAFGFQPGPVTMANLTIGEAGMPKLIAFEGEILDFYQPEFDTPHGRFRPDDSMPDFLDAYAHEGGSHHLAMSPGKHLAHVAKLAELLGINYVEL